jgi:hypothetical protein
MSSPEWLIRPALQRHEEGSWLVIWDAESHSQRTISEQTVSLGELLGLVLGDKLGDELGFTVLGDVLGISLGISLGELLGLLLGELLGESQSSARSMHGSSTL